MAIGARQARRRALALGDVADDRPQVGGVHVHRGRGLDGRATPSGLLRAFEAEGRDQSEAHLSLMTGAVIGEDRDALLRRAGALDAKRGAPDGEAFLENAGPAWIAGTVDEVLGLYLHHLRRPRR